MPTLASVLGLLWLTLAPSQATSPPPPIAVRVRPEPVYADRQGNLLRLSCDIELTNSSEQAFEIQSLWAKAFAADGKLLAWNKVDSNGARPSVEVLGPRRVDPHGALTVFNPFLFDVATAVDHVAFEFRLAAPGGESARVEKEVRPVTFRQKTPLIVPVPGARLWAYDGPGFLSHHRRVDLLNPFNRDILHLRANDQRYAVDLVVVDRDGVPFHGDLSEQKNWVGFGMPIVAPAAGVVVEAEGSLPDDIPFDEARARENPGLMIGNHVVIDHGNGEFSALAHFRNGGVRVRKGQRVAQGEIVGEMGHSGMGAGLVHLHYELRTGPGSSDAEGLPAQFTGFRRAGEAKGRTGEIEAGWIVETPPQKR
jgi:peptidase M23-like protein